MHRMLLLACLCLAAAPASAAPSSDFLSDKQGGTVEIRFLGHASLLFLHGAQTVYVDPVSKYADYASLPKADLVLVTHGHGDHLDLDAISAVRKTDTVVLLPPSCAGRVEGGTALRVDETAGPYAGYAAGKFESGVAVVATHAYNRLHERAPGKPYHPRGEGNGYLFNLGLLMIYVAGDTEDIPELKDSAGVDIAFLPMNLPYTMTPKMAATASRTLRPRIVYPYHYGETDPQELVKELAGENSIEVRIRDLR